MVIELSAVTPSNCHQKVIIANFKIEIKNNRADNSCHILADL